MRLSALPYSAPPRRLFLEDDRDVEAVDALIEEARRRARRRRRRTGAGVILGTFACAALWIGFATGGDGGSGATGSARAAVRPSHSARTGVVVITMRGYVRVARGLRASRGLVRYLEAGRFRVAWRVPASALNRGGTFQSTSAVVTGAISAIDAGVPARSCHGALGAGHSPVLLRIVGPGSTATTNIGMIASPNPIATAVSARCPRGTRAARWTGSPTGAWIDVVPPRRDPHTDWWEFNHIGAGFYGNFTPLPKGGDSDGRIQGHLPGGSLTWLAVLHMRKSAQSERRAFLSRSS